MAFSVRRVITGHDGTGRAIVQIDEVATHAFVGPPGATACNVWTTEGFPASNDGTEDAGLRKVGVAARNHRTSSIDYIAVISGEIDMELDGSRVHLTAGDVMVQRGTIHNWVNHGSEPCVLSVVLVDAKPVEAGGKLLAAVG